ncbi:hypothetical protein N2152v2_003172 [Parachlorella kessleri]
MFAKPFSPSAALYLSAAQVVLSPIIAAVTKTKLDSTGDCLLNETPGRVCDFVYSTVGFSLLFTLMLAIPTLLWQRNSTTANTAPLIQEAGNLSCFGAFWWMVLSITITARGKQADNAGYAGTAARGAVVAFAWILTALFFFAGLLVYADRILHAYRVKPKGEDDDISSEPDSEGYVYTQALARTPVS